MRRFFPWPGLIFVLIGTTVLVQGTTLFFALGDDGFAVVPDYDAKAQAWDDQSAQARASTALGWSVEPQRSAIDAGAMALELMLLGTSGEVSGRWTAYHNAMPQQRYGGIVQLDDQGLLALPIPDTRQGWWQIELELERGGDRFLYAHKLWLPLGTERSQGAVP